MIDVNNDNSLLLAIKAYDKPNCVMSEFEADYKRFKYVKRLVNKYKNKTDIKERLILNHIIVLANMFGVDITVKTLFLRIPPEDYPVLKTFLVFLNYMPVKISTVNGKHIVSSDIPLDWVLVDLLRKIARGS